MGYKTPEVNWLKISNKKGEITSIEPGIDVAAWKISYRPQALHLLRWEADRLSQKGISTGSCRPRTEVVEKEGFVPLHP